MANLCLGALEYLRGLILASEGLSYQASLIAARDGVELAGFSDGSVLIQNVGSDLAEENVPVIYPAVYLYSDRLDNRLIEKFRQFSGPLFITAEVRVSGERFSGLEGQLARYVEALAVVLGGNRGSWTSHVAFGGAYEVRFERARLGGKNFVQAARFEIELQGFE